MDYLRTYRQRTCDTGGVHARSLISRLTTFTVACSIDKLGVVGALVCASAVLSVGFVAQLALRSAIATSHAQEEQDKKK
jgi:hypothetical protein